MDNEKHTLDTEAGKQRILELKAAVYDLSMLRNQREAAAVQELKSIDQELQQLNAQIGELQKSA